MARNNLIISGEGGQGIQALVKIFCKAAFESGLNISSLPSFGVEQRGTPSVAFISIDNKPIRCPQFETADYVVILQNRAIRKAEEYISPNSKVIFDSSTISEKDLPKTCVHLFGIPATQYANEKFLPKAMNLIILGYLSSIFRIEQGFLIKALDDILGKKFKDKETRNLNVEAFKFGRELVAERSGFSEAIYKSKSRSIIFSGHGKSGEISPKRCKGCAICIAKCPVAALSLSEELGIFATPIPKVDLEKCIACGNCRNFCPDGAINIYKQESK